MSRANVSAPEELPFHTYELWACAQDDPTAPVLYKERQRHVLAPAATVHPVRPFCDPTFRDPATGAPINAEPVWDHALQKLGVQTYLPSGLPGEFVTNYW